MGARSVFNYNNDPKLKTCVDDTADFLTSAVETAYAMTGPTETLKACLQFFLIHKTFVVVKTIVNNAAQFVLMHPELDDIKINMEPVPRLTFVRFLPLSQKEEKLVIGEDNFKVYEGSIADINFLELLRFLGYVSA